MPQGTPRNEEIRNRNRRGDQERWGQEYKRRALLVKINGNTLTMLAAELDCPAGFPVQAVHFGLSPDPAWCYRSRRPGTRLDSILAAYFVVFEFRERAWRLDKSTT